MAFDVKLDCKINGKPTVGNAMETYLFRRINTEWKVQTKVILMIEDKK
jgi:phosphoribosylaminoimidazole-succinocarboxamide synthase